MLIHCFYFFFPFICPTPRSAAAFSGRLERLVRCAMKYDYTESKIDHYELYISFSVFFFFLLRNLLS